MAMFRLTVVLPWEQGRKGGIKAVFRNVNNFNWVIRPSKIDNVPVSMLNAFWEDNLRKIRIKITEHIDNINLRHILLQRYDWLVESSYMEHLSEKLKGELIGLNFETIGKLQEIQKLNLEEFELILPEQSIEYETINDALNFLSEYPFMMEDIIRSLYMTQTEDEIVKEEIIATDNVFLENVLGEFVESRLSDAQPLLF